MSQESPSTNPYDSTQQEPMSIANEGTRISTTGRDAYNIVSDTVTGMNVRKSDNVFQLKVILVSVLGGVPVGAIVGAIMRESGNRLSGATMGGIALGFAGIVLGLIGSGIYLMIYRSMRHLRGKHD